MSHHSPREECDTLHMRLLARSATSACADTWAADETFPPCPPDDPPIPPLPPPLPALTPAPLTPRPPLNPIFRALGPAGGMGMVPEEGGEEEAWGA